MSLPDRRKFLKKSIHTSALAVAGMSSTNLLIGKDKRTNTKSVEATIPKPVQVVIDDVGWWSGKDGSEYQEPYRTGINRNHVTADYQAIVELGKALGIRPQAAFILCEWDRKNILKKVPHSTWMGEKWDNSRWIGPWLEEASDIINSNKEHFEITMHGLGHEWWTNGEFKRAEWADRNGVMRPKDDVQLHIETFAEIMKENNLGELPTSFVPTAFNHGFGITPGNDVSMAEILRSNGFTYINTPFYNMLNKENVQHKILGVDNGVLTVDRGSDIFDWNVIGTKPEGKIEGTTCGMHWPNLLHDDPDRNQEIVEAWVKILAPYQNITDTMLAKNSIDFQKQIAHYNSTKISISDGRIDLDFSDINQLGTVLANDELTLKVSSDRALTFESDQVQIYSVSNKSIDNAVLYQLHINRSNRKKASVRFSDTK
jgi:hypothetical protein